MSEASKYVDRKSIIAGIITISILLSAVYTTYMNTEKYEVVAGDSAYMVFNTIECRLRAVALLPPPGIIALPRCGIGKGSVDPIAWLPQHK